MAVSFQAMQAAILSRYKLLVADVHNLATSYPNAPDFTPPTDGSLWARVTILPGNARQASLGSPGANLFRTPGVLVVQLFDRVGHGTKDLLEMANAVSDVFRAVTVGDIVYLAPSISLPGREDHWYPCSVSCPFHYDALA
jgi:hypothetical protein